MEGKCEKCGGTMVADWITDKSYTLDCPACCARAQRTAELKEAVVEAAMRMEWGDMASWRVLKRTRDALEAHLKETA